MQQMNYDIVVIGGGGSGMVAAVRAAQCSGKKVLVLEKAAQTGGGARFASTTRTFQSKWQMEHGIEDRTAAFVRKVMDYTYWRLDPELVRNCIRGTGEFFDWFCEQVPDVESLFFPGYYVFDTPGEDQEGPVYGVQNNGTGRLVMEKMLELCDTYGIDVWTQSPAVDIEAENGSIVAVRATHDGEDIRISCGACILASGSWIQNQEIMKKICPVFLEAEMEPSAHTNPNYTGDGIAMAKNAGAFLDFDSFCLRLMGPKFSSRSRVLNDAAGSDFAISVNLNGKRYVSEPMTYHMKDFFDTGHVLLQQPKAVTYAIFDENTLAAAIKKAAANPESSFAPIPCPSYPNDEAVLRADIQKGINANDGKAFMSDTLEELADMIGVDRDVFTETVTRYNESCANGFDRDFFRPESFLVPLSKPPYYAVRGYLMTDGAFGGVEVNADMQAKAADGALVDGLFVTGDFASGRHINMDGVKRQVLNDISWAFSSGFIAGTNAAKLFQ